MMKMSQEAERLRQYLEKLSQLEKSSQELWEESNQKEKTIRFFDQEDLDKIDKFYGAGLDLTDLDELGDRLIELNDSVVKAVAKRDAEAVIIPVVEPPPAVVPEPEPTTE